MRIKRIDRYHYWHSLLISELTFSKVRNIVFSIQAKLLRSSFSSAISSFVSSKRLPVTRSIVVGRLKGCSFPYFPNDIEENENRCSKISLKECFSIWRTFYRKHSYIELGNQGIICSTRDQTNYLSHQTAPRKRVHPMCDLVLSMPIET